MKELWMLLLSAQKNASGVPQQFLDAKEEELLKKKVLESQYAIHLITKYLYFWGVSDKSFVLGMFQAESDLIASEIQRKKDKEGREIMEERLKKLVILLCTCWRYILQSRDFGFNFHLCFHGIQLASAIIWVHVLYLKLLQDGGFDSKDNDTASDPTLKLRDSGYREWDGKETDKRNGVRARSR